jgi:hypothetical protein
MCLPRWQPVWQRPLLQRRRKLACQGAPLTYEGQGPAACQSRAFAQVTSPTWAVDTVSGGQYSGHMIHPIRTLRAILDGRRYDRRMNEAADRIRARMLTPEEEAHLDRLKVESEASWPEDEDV